MDSPDVNVRARPGSRILYRTKFSQDADENGRERILRFSQRSPLLSASLVALNADKSRLPRWGREETPTCQIVRFYRHCLPSAPPGYEYPG